MCGIFGITVPQSPNFNVENLRKHTEFLFLLSESRGKEAAGLTLIPKELGAEVQVLKSPNPASELIKQREFIRLFNDSTNNATLPVSLFGHTRLVTNGDQTSSENNQPVVRGKTVIVHNGIIVNVNKLWETHPELVKKSDLDTEVLAALLDSFVATLGSPHLAIQKVFSLIEGTASIIAYFAGHDQLVLATNNGSLYVSLSSDATIPIVYASEKYILERFLREKLHIEDTSIIHKVEPSTGLTLNTKTCGHKLFSLNETATQVPQVSPSLLPSIKILEVGHAKYSSLPTPKIRGKNLELETFYADAMVASQKLKRCSTCVMPESVPFINFDKQGVCNFCRNYKAIKLKPVQELEQILGKYRRSGSEADCVAALSGGRDSCYGLHLIVKDLKMKPLTYTYDWGMVTDLARRNISRVCSKLGIENIIISADIGWKRENIRKNVEAWLRSPHLGMIPLFMAGDKEFVYHSQRIKKQSRIELDIFTFNLMEKTQFKEEFTGIQMWTPGEDADKLGEQLPFWSRIKLAWFYFSQFATNTGYWNRSLADTFWGYIAYYYMPQTFVPLFQYLPWIEEDVNQLLVNEYDWELSLDTPSTWRIGDGTAPFYNYIYFVMAGFTENDTLRSNQIREGHLTRDRALALTNRDNIARWSSLGWYCDITGLDFDRTIRRINEFAWWKSNSRHKLLS
jgi:glucosamine--fructose-6-phosphate aminotransferase (isomerizing)